MAHPCVDKSNSDPEDRVYHHYYQWVFLVLTLQAIAFYVPHQFWKAKEGRLIFKLTDTLREPVVCENEKEQERQDTLSRVADYFVPVTKDGRRIERTEARHQEYFYSFAISEAANLFNVIVQMYLVNEFLGGTFTTYGLDVLRYSELDQEERVDPMVSVFPKMTKCTFHRFGSSGDVQRYDALCILPLNIVNEKIYIVMWFWFVFLAVVSSVWLVIRAVTMLNPDFRVAMLTRQAVLADIRQVRYVVTHLDSGDWFLLTMMCKNMDSIMFRSLIDKIYDNLRKLPTGKNNHNSESGRSNKKLLPDDDSDAEISLPSEEPTPAEPLRSDSIVDDFEGIRVEK